MAYIPDEWVMGNLEIAPSAVRLLFYYCGRADHDTGETNVSTRRASQDLGIRKDHIDEHDRKLVRKGLIRIERTDDERRVIHMLSPWQSRARRTEQKTAGKATSQDLGKSVEVVTQKPGSPLDEFPKLGENPQNLGEVTQNLGKSSQNLGTHIRNNQLMNQPIEPTVGAGAPGKSRKSSGEKPKSRFHNHPSVIAYRQILGFNTLNAAQADLIAVATGEDADRAPPEWLKFLRELAETGNKHAHNVRVMVLAFARYKNKSPLSEALGLAWDETQGRNNGKPQTGKNNDANSGSAQKTTDDYGIRDCKVLGQ